MSSNHKNKGGFSQDPWVNPYLMWSDTFHIALLKPTHAVVTFILKKKVDNTLFPSVFSISLLFLPLSGTFLSYLNCPCSKIMELMWELEWTAVPSQALGDVWQWGDSFQCGPKVFFLRKIGLCLWVQFSYGIIRGLRMKLEGKKEIQQTKWF